MKTLAGAALTTTLSLVLPGNALARTPQLLVSGSPWTGASGTTMVEVKAPAEDAAPMKVTIYLPTGYTTNLLHAAGTQIGVVHADWQALALSPGTIVRTDGTVLTADPWTYLTNTCAPGTHAAVWLLHVTAAGTALDVPVYVDPTSGAEAALGAAKLVLCLANPYEQATPTASRSPFGAKLVDAKLTLAAGVVTNPRTAGASLWRSLVMPWDVNGATPNAAGTVEAQAIVKLPVAASLTAKVRTVSRKKKVHGRTRIAVASSVLLSGRLLETHEGVAGAKVTFFANGTTAGSATTNASGAFAKRAGLSRKKSFRARIVAPTREAPCANPLTSDWAPAGCVSATISGYAITTSTVAATPRRWGLRGRAAAGP